VIFVNYYVKQITWLPLYVNIYFPFNCITSHCTFVLCMKGDLVAVGVLSGNRNFEGRIHPMTRANYLASPPLVIAYALAGTVLIDFETEPIGESLIRFVTQYQLNNRAFSALTLFVGRQEGQSGALFTWHKKQNFRKVSCVDRAQNLSWPAPNNILGVPQISSKSVHFRRSYSWMREHRWNAPQVFPILGEASSPSNKLICS